MDKGSGVPKEVHMIDLRGDWKEMPVDSVVVAVYAELNGWLGFPDGGTTAAPEVDGAVMNSATN